MRLNDPHLRVIQMSRNPLRINQHLRKGVVCHRFYLVLLLTKGNPTTKSGTAAYRTTTVTVSSAGEQLFPVFDSPATASTHAQ